MYSQRCVSEPRCVRVLPILGRNCRSIFLRVVFDLPAACAKDRIANLLAEYAPKRGTPNPFIKVGDFRDSD